MTDYHNDSAMSWPLNTAHLEMSPRGRSTRATGFRRQSATSPRIPVQREESPGWPLPKPQRRQPAAIVAKQSCPDLHSRLHTTAAHSQEHRAQSSPHEPVQRQDVPPPSPLRHRLRAKASKLKLVITRGVPDHHLAQSPCGCLASGCHCDDIRVISDPVAFQHVSHASRDQYFNMKATTQEGLLTEFALPRTPYEHPPIIQTPRIPRRKAVQSPETRTVRAQQSFDAMSVRSSAVPSLVSGSSGHSSCRSTSSVIMGGSSCDNSPLEELLTPIDYPYQVSHLPRQSFSQASTPATPELVYELEALELSLPPKNHLNSTFSFEFKSKTLQDAIPHDLLVEPSREHCISKKSSSRSLKAGKLDYRSANRGAEEYVNRPLPPLPLAPIRKPITRSPTQPSRRKPVQEVSPVEEAPLAAILAKYQHTRKRSSSNPELPAPRFNLYPTVAPKAVTVKGDASDVESIRSALTLPPQPTRDAPGAPRSPKMATSKQARKDYNAILATATTRQMSKYAALGNARLCLDKTPSTESSPNLSLFPSPPLSPANTFKTATNDYFGPRL